MAEARTFRVALVRARGKRRGRVRLQALRREMALVVGDAELRVGMRAETQAVVVRVSAEEIKGVRVKGRLVRVRKDSAALTYVGVYDLVPRMRTCKRDVCAIGLEVASALRASRTRSTRPRP